MNASKKTLYRAGCNGQSLEPSGASEEGVDVKAGPSTSPRAVRGGVCIAGELL